MTAPQLSLYRRLIQSSYLADETKAVQNLIRELDLDAETRARICNQAVKIVETLRSSATPGMMEVFLAEYGLSTQEGVALMCLAEALLRVPDDVTIDALIQDKIAPANWSSHLGKSCSPLVNSSTWALLLTGKVIDQKHVHKWDIPGNIRALIKRAGDPVIRKAVAQSMKILGHQFVLGRNIDNALKRAKFSEERGYTYSYDMLGEAARTAEDAKRYFMAYAKAISAISNNSSDGDIRNNPGISVKLSALHPRYEFGQAPRVMNELAPRLASLVHQAKNANMGFNIDAEEADRLDLSLDVIEAVLSNPDLKGWEGFGVVVQAYSPRASMVLEWLYELSRRLDRKIMVRLVKGAYWDTEIKLAQTTGLEGYPVFTRKASSDISYMACAKKLLKMTDRIYPQFATHNAHSVATILELAGDRDCYEFQRLHGMGEALHKVVKDANKSRCRIYAPVGIHEDLLAYLVRRLLENGANSSFVNQVLDEKVPAQEVVKDPVAFILAQDSIPNPKIPLPAHIYREGRKNSKGPNLANPPVLKNLEEKRSIYRTTKWQAGPIIGGVLQDGKKHPILNPANHEDLAGEAVHATPDHVKNALTLAVRATEKWQATPARERAACLERISDVYEKHLEEFTALLAREAGKTIPDAIAEVREAVDFCRYYALKALELTNRKDLESRGIFTCISPWNFPLAIFTGQIVAALSVGNCVMAKPAEQTPLIAALAVRLMHNAGIPTDALALLPGEGRTVGATLCADKRISGVCFTGSTQTAKAIQKSMADNLDPTAPLIAETGGLNAMIIDSSALPEQAVRDVLASAFQSAGQRCSALRMLYVQEDVAPKVLAMLQGAMDELAIGNPWQMQTDVGPIIDEVAKQTIADHCAKMEAQGRLIKKLTLGSEATNASFIAPAVYRVSGIEDLDQEIFGPILHVATFRAKDLLKVVEAVNTAGYGLTFGMHTRVNNRVQEVCNAAKVGNLYVNRNQIGAVVGVQPFGGEGLSGTGPKAGGPLYLTRFVQKTRGRDAQDNSVLQIGEGTYSDTEREMLHFAIKKAQQAQPTWDSLEDRRAFLADIAKSVSPELSKKIAQTLEVTQEYHCSPMEMDSPTGESNQLSNHGRGVMLCAGDQALHFALLALLTGNGVVMLGESEPGSALERALQCHGAILIQVPLALKPEGLSDLEGISGIALKGGDGVLKCVRQALAARDGAILPLIFDITDWPSFMTERTLCVDTTASGGNAALLATN